MRAIVDRIEGNVVVIEVEGEYLDLEIEKCPSNISEGDIIDIIDDEIKILDKETEDRTKYINDLFNSLIDNSN